MGLDIRTMMVMTALLTLMLSCLLMVASRHGENIRGIRRWALAELSIALGFGLAFTQLHPPYNYWYFVLGATLLVIGMNLQQLGIRVFRGWRADWWLMAITVPVVLGSSVWFSFVQHDVVTRSIINSMAMALVNAVSARALMLRVEPPLRAAYSFTASVFVLMTLLLLGRSIYLTFFAPHDYWLYAQVPLNPITLFLGSVLQLLLVFGFMLMMHSRIAAELHRLGARDSLTGALNRRSLEEQFEHLRALCARNGGVISVMMIDIDHFKRVNDEYGHLAGDAVLRALADLGGGMIRRQDYFARYGGEEFCILMPSSTEAEAEQLGERLRLAVAGRAIDMGVGPYNATVSIGVADSARAGLEFAELVAAADSALYRAKKTGRNRVVAFSAL